MFDKFKAVNLINTYSEKYLQLSKIKDCVNDEGGIDEELTINNNFLNIYVEPTNRCNLKCSFCARENMSRELKFIDKQTFINSINSLKRGTYISLNGNGEPLLNPHIYDMIKYSSEAGMHVSIITNATALTEKNRRKLADSGISRVQISFQSMDENTYESVMKGANFKKTLEQVLEFIYLVRKEKKDIFISISTVQVAEGEKYKEKSKRFWNKMPIDNYYEGNLLSLQNESKEYREKCTDCNDENYDVCVNPWIAIKINSDGSVNPCVQDFSSKFIIGNINSQPLDEIVNSEKALQFRKAVADGNMKYLKEIGYDCANCNTWTNKIKHGISNFLSEVYPVKLGLVINEISGDRPDKIEYLEQILTQLKDNNFDAEQILNN